MNRVQDGPGILLNMAIVPKRDPNKRRAVLNLKGLNEEVEKEPFKMEMVAKSEECTDKRWICSHNQH